ncbi:muramoyltetrapeptide carboxypeptidase LdcA involved in peptidoglycan recycling [Microbacterium resistens]|uniref:Muramoyltetrapeptide carboxypeptidase LdcA involved in peptidoglycan recycling n=1 Tax=Microbacterium resistens TaxID=156977 RepID=A0ABU1S9H5_9MICO|nr:LD-carboxypeptidase [Microbacterium resistens]MDR6866244.1 muramoyltetrapeptide carboxypeptidase LdcA involved in peptidoglycan recycling [Microbacterium resistens]
MEGMILPPKARPGDRVAVLSPAFAAPAASEAVHEQAMARLRELTGLVPVEYATTRMLDASPVARADDVNAAFADPDIRAILATIGGDDQILVTPHLDPAAARADPKPFLGYSDNTNILTWLWQHGMAAFHGGSTQIHLGAGPAVDEIHARSLRAAVLDGGEIELTEPGESEDFGRRWADPRALHELGDRMPTEPWTWSGPARRVSGRTWGGCLEVLDQLALADRLPETGALAGAVLLLEASERLTPVGTVASWIRALGERGVLAEVAGVLVARPPVSTFETIPSAEEGGRRRAAQRDAMIAEVARYNPEAVVCVGVPFGHTRPQWILPYGGEVVLDGAARTVTASYA